MPGVNRENPKDRNMYTAGLGNARILTDHAQKSPQTLGRSLMLGSMASAGPPAFKSVAIRTWPW